MEKELEFSADYFKTEVRDGFEIPAMMKRAWLHRWKFYMW